MSTSIPTFQHEHFINRELSWLEFNARVLEEAQDSSNSLMERAKFLAIFSSNLDEFFMVRVAGLREQAFGGVAPQDVSADGFTPLAQLQRITERTRQLVVDQYACLNDAILPELAQNDVHILAEKDLDKSQRKLINEFFRQRAFPVLTPMAIDPSHPSPRFHNRGLYLVALLHRSKGFGPADLFAVVQLPTVLPRFVDLGEPGENKYIMLEDLLAAKLPELFGGYEISHHATFRMTRDMDIDVLEQEADDMLRAIELRLRVRQQSEAVRLEVQAGMGEDLLEMLVNEESLHVRDEVDGRVYSDVYHVQGMLDMTCMWDLIRLVEKDALRDPPLIPRQPVRLRRGEGMLSEIAQHDILLHHPFDSFDPVVRFIEEAAEDPDVLAIKQTLYRTSGDSPIVRALIKAAENGKQVTALVELKARFDEANNIIWARQMERAGVHVVYGFMDLKTHSKLAMVVRQEGKKVRRYVHLSTGNYNPTTARLYTDLGLFTSDKEFAEDASALFNFLTGYSQGHEWQKLILAPVDLHRLTIELIQEQTERARAGKKCSIFAKLNSLVDRETIESLYIASQAGVPIELVIRGICCLRPGLPGISETIQVRSIVDRFLEHSRILVFGEGSKAKVFLSSADWMPRNFDRRVEVMFPVEAPELRKRIIEEIIPTYLRDNTRSRILMADGSYVRPVVSPGNTEYRAQYELLGLPPVAAENRAVAVEEPMNGQAKESETKDMAKAE
ncbi:polyphosphate kinase 1 [Bythopirellula polymerisocia]|uniref:Polyphosphate kinase n=1 Tax=Bythopirellula polymerisocia TaxID=2528003 RepID=A0A5C6CVC6_9BACT|nr:polyphosphate kinase 1 [Bythopirellula polymerisocia]TWU28540.1 Polyphosphate kinase [Bythopirellula polymerisocia]